MKDANSLADRNYAMCLLHEKKNRKKCRDICRNVTEEHFAIRILIRD